MEKRERMDWDQESCPKFAFWGKGRRGTGGEEGGGAGTGREEEQERMNGRGGGGAWRRWAN